MKKLTPIFLFTLILASCATEKKESKQNTPIGVARIWLENYYYHNNYELAKSYSTPQTAEMIDTIKSMIFPDLDNVEKLAFEIKNVQCRQKVDAVDANCTCKYIEGGESFTEELLLVKIDGQWLVDTPLSNEHELLLDEDIEQISNDFEKSLDKLLDQ